MDHMYRLVQLGGTGEWHVSVGLLTKPTGSAATGCIIVPFAAVVSYNGSCSNEGTRSGKGITCYQR